MNATLSSVAMLIVVVGAVVIYQAFHKDLWWYGIGVGDGMGGDYVLGEKLGLIAKAVCPFGL